MKKLLVLAIVLMVALSSAAGAADWLWSVQASANAAGGGSMGPAYFGVMADLAGFESFAPIAAGAAQASILDGGNTYMTAIYAADPNKTAWNFTVHSNTDYTATKTYLTMVNGAGFDVPMVSDLTWTLKVKADPTSKYAANAVLWTGKVAADTVINVVLDSAWKTSAPVTSGLQLEFTAVPEPSSIVAMFSGLVGLAGFGIRRRK